MERSVLKPQQLHIMAENVDRLGDPIYSSFTHHIACLKISFSSLSCSYTGHSIYKLKKEPADVNASFLLLTQNTCEYMTMEMEQISLWNMRVSASLVRNIS